MWIVPPDLTVYRSLSHRNSSWMYRLMDTFGRDVTALIVVTFACVALRPATAPAAIAPAATRASETNSTFFEPMRSFPTGSRPRSPSHPTGTPTASRPQGYRIGSRNSTRIPLRNAPGHAVRRAARCPGAKLPGERRGPFVETDGFALE